MEYFLSHLFGVNMFEFLDWMDRNCISPLLKMSQSVRQIQTASREKYKYQDWLPQIVFSPFQIFISKKLKTYLQSNSWSMFIHLFFFNYCRHVLSYFRWQEVKCTSVSTVNHTRYRQERRQTSRTMCWRCMYLRSTYPTHADCAATGVPDCGNSPGTSTILKNISLRGSRVEIHSTKRSIWW